jgi:hypothetical protein
MKKIIPPILSLVCTLILFSCGKETQTITPVKQKFYVKAKISPPLQTGQSQGPGSNNFLKIYLPPLEEIRWYGVSNTQILTEFSSKEIELNSGEVCSATIRIQNQYDLKCRTITLEGIQNGKVIQTYTLNMGASPSGTACTDGVSVQKSFTLQ